MAEAVHLIAEPRTGRGIPPASPEAVGHDGDHRGRHDQDDTASSGQPCEDRRHVVPQQVADHHPQSRIHQRAGNVVPEKATIAKMPAATENRREEANACRVPAEQNRGRPKAAEILHRVVDAPLGTEGQPAVEGEQRGAATPAHEVEHVIAEQGPRRARDDCEGQLKFRLKESSGEDQDNTPGKRDSGGVDGVRDENRETDVAGHQADERQSIHDLSRRTSRGRATAMLLDAIARAAGFIPSLVTLGEAPSPEPPDEHTTPDDRSDEEHDREHDEWHEIRDSSDGVHEVPSCLDLLFQQSWCLADHWRITCTMALQNCPQEDPRIRSAFCRALEVYR